MVWAPGTLSGCPSGAPGHGGPGPGRRLGPAGGCFPHVPPTSHRCWAPRGPPVCTQTTLSWPWAGDLPRRSRPSALASRPSAPVMATPHSARVLAPCWSPAYSPESGAPRWGGGLSWQRPLRDAFCPAAARPGAGPGARTALAASTVGDDDRPGSLGAWPLARAPRSEAVPAAAAPRPQTGWPASRWATSAGVRRGAQASALAPQARLRLLEVRSLLPPTAGRGDRRPRVCEAPAGAWGPASPGCLGPGRPRPRTAAGARPGRAGPGC